MIELPGGAALLLDLALALWLAAAVIAAAGKGGAVGKALPALLMGLGGALALGACAAAGDGSFGLFTPQHPGAALQSGRLDPLARWFIAIIGLVALAVAGFTPGYLLQPPGRTSSGFVPAALSMLLASAAGVVVAGNALTFLLAWELMALSSFCLAAAPQDRRGIGEAGLAFLGATRFGAAFLWGGVFWARHLSGSWEFSAWALAAAGPAASWEPLGPALFMLLGLAVSAGCWPFHLWLPITHAAAPAPGSALISGVMTSAVIYALVRLLVAGPLWVPDLGPVLLVLGAISAFWGALFALLQQDLKRLLAYNGIANVGIILIGLGMATVGRSLHLPLVHAVGLAAALFHTLNHACFQSLLFLGAGVVESRTHTRNLERLGGLIHRLPWTGVCFLVGSAAACLLPPLNGFAGGWLLYQALFNLAISGTGFAVRLGGLLLVGWLALVAALMLAGFVRTVGIVFLGRPRTPDAEHAREGDRGMVTAQGLLAIPCCLLGLAAPLVLRVLTAIAAPAGASSNLVPVWDLPLPLLSLLMGGMVTGMALWISTLRQELPTRRTLTWDGGYGDPQPAAQCSAAGFRQPFARLFGLFYRYDVRVTVEGLDRRHFPESVRVTPRQEPNLEIRLCSPLIQWCRRGTLMKRLAAVSIHHYLLFMAAALGILLWLGGRG